jgi:hypothetical protein
MKREAVTRTDEKPVTSSVTLGRWVILVRRCGVFTPLTELSNEEVDRILAQVDEMAGEAVPPVGASASRDGTQATQAKEEAK